MAAETTAASRDPIYDPLAPEVIADPHAFYRKLREHSRVYWHDVLDSYVLTGHAECRGILGDPAIFASDFRRVGEEMPESHLSVQTLDPPEHGGIRHLLVAALHEQSPTAMADHVAALAAEQVSRVTGRDRPVDLVGEFARPLALRTVCDFLGVQTPDGARFEAMSNAIVRSMDAGLDPERAAPGTRARADLSAMTAAWLRDTEGTGFLGAALKAHRKAPDVPEPVLANSLRAVLHAGYESVSRLLGNALARLVADPSLLAGAAGARRLDALADELVRLDGPVQATARVCVTDRTVNGHPLRQGDIVTLFLAAANRDPEVFPQPDEVDLGRRRGLHLGFGRGAHACLGASLAALQLRAVLTALADSGVALEAAAPPVQEATATLRGLVSLPVTVRDGSRPAPRTP